VADPVERPDHPGPPDPEHGGDSRAEDKPALAFDPEAVADEIEAEAAEEAEDDLAGLDVERDESLAEIAEQEAPLDKKKLISRVLLLLVTAVAFYVLAPAIGEVFTTWDRLGETQPLWLIGAFLAESASFVSLWWLFKIAMPGVSWFTIACSQLASNALSRVVPGGAAPGGALQYKMLADGEADRTQAATGLTAVSLLSTATLFAIPVLTIPTVAFGRPVPEGLAQAAWVGGVLFVALAGVTAWLLGPDSGVRVVARAVAALRRLFARTDTDVRALGDRLITERNTIRTALGERWAKALFASAGKWGFDYLCLVAALSAVGSSPRPALVLLAYTAAQILGMIPITPGGIGFVEAGLTATLALAGVGAADAALATLIYRLMSFWLPLPAGLVAWGLFRAKVRRRLAKAGSPGPGPDPAPA
jgi:uncharacterized protein (TIRG00374 family)